MLLFTGCINNGALTTKETADKIAECRQYDLVARVVFNTWTNNITKIVCLPK